MSIKCKILIFSPNQDTRDKFLYRKQHTNFQSNSSFLAVQWPEKVKLMKSYFTLVNAIRQIQWFHYWDLIKIKILSNWFLGENPSAPSIKLYFRQKFTQSLISDWWSQDMTSLDGKCDMKRTRKLVKHPQAEITCPSSYLHIPKKTPPFSHQRCTKFR